MCNFNITIQNVQNMNGKKVEWRGRNCSRSTCSSKHRHNWVNTDIKILSKEVFLVVAGICATGSQLSLLIKMQSKAPRQLTASECAAHGWKVFVRFTCTKNCKGIRPPTWRGEKKQSTVSSQSKYHMNWIKLLQFNQILSSCSSSDGLSFCMQIK